MDQGLIFVLIVAWGSLSVGFICGVLFAQSSQDTRREDSSTMKTTRAKSSGSSVLWTCVCNPIQTLPFNEPKAHRFHCQRYNLSGRVGTEPTEERENTKPTSSSMLYPANRGGDSTRQRLGESTSDSGSGSRTHGNVPPGVAD